MAPKLPGPVWTTCRSQSELVNPVPGPPAAIPARHSRPVGGNGAGSQKVVDIGSRRRLNPASDQAEQILAQNAAQIIAMARPLIADPYLPNKAQTGQQDLIRPCIRCNECLNHLRSGRELRCSVNANGGLELRPQAHRPASRSASWWPAVARPA